MSTLKFEFDTDEDRSTFMAWLSDGGGENDFHELLSCHDKPFLIFDYAKAFPAWGYDSDKDGDPLIRITGEE